MRRHELQLSVRRVVLVRVVREGEQLLAELLGVGELLGHVRRVVQHRLQREGELHRYGRGQQQRLVLGGLKVQDHLHWLLLAHVRIGRDVRADLRLDGEADSGRLRRAVSVASGSADALHGLEPCACSFWR